MDRKPTPALTFDNLGEASGLERAARSDAAPLRRHPTVHTALPRLLDALPAHGLGATFFIEPSNCQLQPDLVARLTTGRVNGG